ncbi:ATP-binding protein [Streptomyces sp. NPDC048639]|uniref:ATP-binding protein n=1 Tax=Streptomyces sp. NPDC048639 TaxID=3365581 RepID=UPI00372092A3
MAIAQGRAPAPPPALVRACAARSGRTRVITLDLESDATSAHRVRTATRQVLAHWGLLTVAGVADAMELAVTELVTNAVQHACGPVQVRWHRRPDHVLVEVFDGSPVRPRPRPSAAGQEEAAEHGRGLALVDACTDAWGWSGSAAGEEPELPGKHVWFVCLLDSERRSRAA